MKKFVFLFALAAVSVATAAANRSAATVYAAGQAVQGTVVTGNVAKTKDGFRFLNAGRVANVERTRLHQIVGTYACVNGTNGQAAHCRLKIEPTVITCTGEAGGDDQCVLRARLPVMN